MQLPILAITHAPPLPRSSQNENESRVFSGQVSLRLTGKVVGVPFHVRLRRSCCVVFHLRPPHPLPYQLHLASISSFETV
jgi:hypothetical protein